MKNMFVVLIGLLIVGNSLAYIPEGCDAYVTCSDGGHVYCSGSNECSGSTSNGGSVTCDGKTTKC